MPKITVILPNRVDYLASGSLRGFRSTTASTKRFKRSATQEIPSLDQVSSVMHVFMVPVMMKAAPFHFARVAGLALALMASAHADEIRSPFLPPNVNGSGGGAVDPNAMQLRGIMSTPTGIKYNIYDPGKKSSVWVGVNEAGNGFLIKSADAQRDLVTMSANGQVITLELQKGHVQTPAANGVPQGGAVLRPTPADEQLRLQAVADEVRRRRLLREQAANAQPGAPGVVGATPDGMLPPAAQPGSNRQRRRD